MTLLDASGEPVQSSRPPKSCSKCGSSKIQKTDGFGGYWQVNCLKCGHTLSKGKED